YDENVADALRLRAMLDAIDGCPAPVVAHVQGHALGGGCGLVACSDVVVAEPQAQFGFSEVKLGIVPAVISPFALAKIGAGAARRYFVTGERFDARTALRIGLIHEVAPDLDAAVASVVGELLDAGPAAGSSATSPGTSSPSCSRHRRGSSSMSTAASERASSRNSNAGRTDRRRPPTTSTSRPASRGRPRSSSRSPTPSRPRCRPSLRSRSSGPGPPPPRPASASSNTGCALFARTSL